MADLEDVTLDGRPLQSLRVADLKAALEERGLSKSGQKNALVKRLKGALMLENLQRTSTAHIGLQPNSQIGEEMSQNSFIKQYLAKQQELLRQRLEREAREAFETNDQEAHAEVNNSTSCPPPAQDVTPASAEQHKPPGPSGAGNEVEGNRNEEADMSGPPASGSVAMRVSGGEHRPERGSTSSEVAADSDDEDSEDGEEDADDDDWDSNARRRSLREPARAPTTRERSGASCQPQQQHIPSLLSPQLRQPTPPPSPPPELSFPLPDTPKQSPPSPDVAPGRRSSSTSSSGSSSSGSRSSSPEPQRSGPAERKPGPLTLLARKMESEGAFSGAGWHGGDGEGDRQGSGSPSGASFPARGPLEGLVSAITHTTNTAGNVPSPMNPGTYKTIIGGHPAHSQVHVRILKSTVTGEKGSEAVREAAFELERQEKQRKLDQERAIELERERALALEREEKQRALEKEMLEHQQALEREEQEKALQREREKQERELALEQERQERELALERERQERELALERERQEREVALAKQREEQEQALARERALELERQRAFEQERLQRESEEREKQERLQREREEREKQERLQREREEREKQERLQREREERERAMELERAKALERERALEQERLDRERVLEAERKEKERKERELALEQERLKREKLEREKALEEERIKREKALEQERLERERALEQERLERERALEQERLERERVLEKEKLERERALEQERLEKEEALERERIEREKAIERERLEKEKALAQERLEKERAIEQERLEKEKAREQERLEREKAIEQERLERKEKERVERLEQEREKALELEREKKERAEREAALKKERVEREAALEKERVEREAALEKERVERERVEKAERERLEREKALEQERLEMERALDNERKEKERALEEERERLVKEKAMQKEEQEKALVLEHKPGLVAKKEKESCLPPAKRGCEIDLAPLPTTSLLSTGPARKSSAEAREQEDVHSPMSRSVTQAAETGAPTSPTPLSPQSSFKKFRLRDSPIQPQSSSIVIKRPRSFSDTPQPQPSPLVSPISVGEQQQKGHQPTAKQEGPQVQTKLEAAISPGSPGIQSEEKTSSKEQADPVKTEHAVKDSTKKIKVNESKSILTPLDVTQREGRSVKKEEKMTRQRSSSSDSSSSDSDSSSSRSSRSSASSQEETSSISRGRGAGKSGRDSSPQHRITEEIGVEKIPKASPRKRQRSGDDVHSTAGDHVKKSFTESSTQEETQRKRKDSEREEEKDKQRQVTEIAMAEPEKLPENCEETPKTSARKISLSSNKLSPGTSSAEGDQDSGAPANRKRRWGSSTAVTTKKPSISITTDSLKSLIPDIRPCLGQEAVVDLHPEEAVLSGIEEEEREQSDQDLQIRRTVTQVVHSESQENGQKETKRSRLEELEEEDVQEEGERTRIKEEKIDTSSPGAVETQSPSHTSHDVEINTVTPSDTLVRRSISQQKTGVSITIDDPVRTSRQPSPPRGKVSNIVHICNLVRPFTLGQLKELLRRTGTLMEEGFWIDKIKSHCYVTYSSSEEAVATRAALHGVKWPQSNPKVLSVDFCLQDELDFHKGLGAADRPGAEDQGPGSGRGRTAGLPSLLPERDQWADREREMERREKARAEREWDRDKVREFGKLGGEKEEGPQRSRSREKRRKERGKSKEKKTEKKAEKTAEDPPAKLLDDLFRKTKAAPCIYWLPLTDEQFVERENARAERMKEREKRRKEQEAEEEKKREEERKERMKTGGGTAGDRSEGEKDKDRDRERDRERGRDRERERENDKPRGGYRRPGGSGAGGGGGRHSRSRSDPRDRRR
ncbi:apoptotic chromatin condensation inducer in the nucleus isoform X3 [Solea solea]|uniref:apoptotic chromatin condensation inducer in the nucleus isoform X3 n=1 Tax=Solea solea TaxID=90069 RepID=UPI00272C33D1|nr:apoptotic chromatin condensation inducer in the nucleus isoform X3 [Solea solea]